MLPPQHGISKYNVPSGITKTQSCKSWLDNFSDGFFNSTLLDKETPGKTKIQKRYNVVLATLSVSSIPSSFPEALDSCFGGKLLRYANLTPTLELDAERHELRENPLLKLG